jgi:hypothetical protein
MYVEQLPKQKRGKKRELGSLSTWALGSSKYRGRRRFFQKPAGRSGPVYHLKAPG